MAVRIISDSGREITSVEQWLEHAPPAGATRHWKDGRSAKELAKAWFRSGQPQVPREIFDLAMENGLETDVCKIRAIPEKADTARSTFGTSTS